MSNQSTFLNTPPVECQWMHFKEPTTNLDANGIYEGELLLDINIPEEKAFLTSLKPFVPEGAKKLPWKRHKTRDGVFVVKLKQKAKTFANGKTFEFKPKVYDAQAQPIVDIPFIGNGSKVIVNIELRPFTNNGKGLRLNPAAVQIIELVDQEINEEAGTVNSANPFAAQEGGGFVQHNPGFSNEEKEVKQEPIVNIQQEPAQSQKPVEKVALDEFDF